MVNTADLREWVGHHVVDAKGKKIGSLEAVYVDTRSDDPAMATVTTGHGGRRRLVFVPVHDAVVGPDYVEVPFSKPQVKSAPSIETDGVLAAEDEPGIFGYYGLPYEPGMDGERRLARR